MAFKFFCTGYEMIEVPWDMTAAQVLEIATRQAKTGVSGGLNVCVDAIKRGTCDRHPLVVWEIILHFFYDRDEPC
jgi:hypothetical protein